MDELVETGDFDEVRVGPRKVEIAEQAERRVPGDRFAPDPRVSRNVVCVIRTTLTARLRHVP